MGEQNSSLVINIIQDCQQLPTGSSNSQLSEMIVDQTAVAPSIVNVSRSSVENQSVLVQSLPTYSASAVCDATINMYSSKMVHSNCITQPIILGNLAGTNLLTAAVMSRKEEKVSTSNARAAQCVDMSSFINSQVLNVIPVFVQSNNDLLNALDVVPYDANKNNDSIDSTDVRQAGEKLHLRRSGTESSFANRPLLSSSDTMILDTSDTLQVSVSNLFEENLGDHVLLKNVSTLKDKPFNLIKNISEGSVSLESIPTISLFKPEPEEINEVNNEIIYQPMTEQIDTACTSKTKEIAIIGADKIPQSIFLFIKNQQRDNASIQNGIIHLSDIAVREQNSLKKASDGCGDEALETDTENNETESVFCGRDISSKKGRQALHKSDTLILPMDNEARKESDLTHEDTIILPSELDQRLDQRQGEDKLSEGFSLNSLSTDSAGTQVALSTIESFGDRLGSLERSPYHLPVTQTSNSVIAGENFNKSLYLMTSDGQLTALGYVTTDQNTLTTLGIMKTVDVKETQTELVFGKDDLFFQPVNTILNEHNCNTEGISSVLLTEQLTLRPPVTATSVVSHGNNQQNLTQTSLNNSKEVTALTEPLHQSDTLKRNLLPISKQSHHVISSLQTLKSSSADQTVSLGKSKFKCLDCNEEFKSKQERNKHVKTHAKLFKCDLCNANFTRMGNFTRHRKIHNLQPESLNLFKCDDCGREFLQRCDLKRHLLIHAKQEPHRCEKCGKGYIRHSDLVVHLRFHNKDKAFMCTMCDKKFFQTGDLSRHIRRAHKPSSQLTCGHCDRKYACETTLIRHMKVVHKDIILQTVNQRLREREFSDKSQSVNNKDVLFTMTRDTADVK